MSSTIVVYYKQHTHRSTHPLYFTMGNGRSIRLDRLPQSVQFSELAVLGQIERQGRKTITRRTGPGLKTLAFTQVVGNRNASRDWDCESDLQAALYPARSGHRFRISGAASRLEQTTWWVAVEATVTVTHRTPTGNRATRAEIEWSLQEWVGDPVTAKPKPAPVKTTTPTASKTPATTARTYTVRSGDSLWKISARLLGRGTRWREIYNLNRSTIKNPNVIRPGMKLKVPRK